jgi:anti-anti-sigma factor
MQVHAEQKDGVTVVYVRGRVDANSAGDVQRCAEERIERGERRLVFDLGETEYFSSAGLRVLLVAAKRLNELGGSAAVAAPRPQVRRVLEVTALNKVIRICATLKEACA